MTGQDGSFLAELLLECGYEVIGVVRSGSGDGSGASEHLRGRLRIVPGELLDPSTLQAVVADARPDELYHLAVPTFVPESRLGPASTLSAIAGARATLPRRCDRAVVRQ